MHSGRFEKTFDEKGGSIQIFTVFPNILSDVHIWYRFLFDFIRVKLFLSFNYTLPSKK
jgi:hypothetical protein